MSRKKRNLIVSLLLATAFVCAAVGGWLCYDNFVDRSGWILKDGSYRYLDFHAHPLTGFQEIDGVTFCFDDQGDMRTGWVQQNGSTYWFGTDGAMRRGQQTVDGKDYCFDADGAMCTGWTDVGGKRFYYGDDGVMCTGWLTMDTDVWYLTENGLTSGIENVDGTDYLFSEEGKLSAGWAEADGKRYYFTLDGKQGEGWLEDGGKRYYLGPDGTPAIGWLNQGEYLYYLNDDGSAAVGEQEIDGTVYYFTPKGIRVVLVNNTHKVPDGYDADLTIFVDWFQISAIAKEPLQAMLNACEEAGCEYRINSIYRSKAQQQEILTSRVQGYVDNGMDGDRAYAKARETVLLPGTSEHHLGLAADIMGEEALKWLSEHCWEYGFILRYPDEKKDITGIIYEPWHFRYVGTLVSMDMKDSGLCLEEYLGAVPAEQ